MGKGIEKELSDQPPIIKYTGVFEFDKLYSTIVKWYKSHGFNMQEKKYVYKGKELEFEWFGDKKITNYYKYEVEVAMFIWDMGDTEVVKDEKTLNMQKGRIQIIIKGKFILDYAGQWEGKYAKVLRDIYHKYIFDKDILFNIYTPLYRLVYGFYDEVRNAIGMEHT